MERTSRYRYPSLASEKNVNIRTFTPADLAELERLYHLHYEKEYSLPKFMEMICAFVVEDDKGPILYGGVRDVPEAIAITDLSRAPLERAAALYRLLDASVFVCKSNNYEQMYVWTQNGRYARRLLQNGFRHPDGESLIFDL